MSKDYLVMSSKRLVIWLEFNIFFKSQMNIQRDGMDKPYKPGLWS